MDEVTLKALPWETKEWLAQAIAGMVLADGTVAPEEVGFLQDAIRCLIEPHKIQEFVTMVKERKAPKIEFLRTNQENAFELYTHVVSICIADDKLTKSEADYMRMIGGKLGFDPDLCTGVVNWANDVVQANRRRKELRSMALRTELHYKEA